MEREQYIKILRSGKIADFLTVIYDFRSGGHILIDNSDKAEMRVEYISDKSTKAYIGKYTNNRVKDIELQDLPKYRTTYDPQKSFGALTDIDFNVYHEPSSKSTVEGRVHPDFGKLFLNLFEDKGGVEYGLHWVANLVQGYKNETSIYFHGRQGAGKGTFNALIEAMVGSTNCIEPSNEALTGNHNEELAYVRYIGWNELNSLDKNHTVLNKIKTMITDKYMNINPKGRKAYKVPNVANHTFSSNSANAIKIPFDDRRISAFQQKKSLKEVDTDLSNRLNKLINSDEIFRLKQFLINLDLSDWDSRTPFENETRRRMMMNTATEKEYLINIIEEEQGRNTKDLFLDDLLMGAESDLDYSFVENSDSYKKAIEGTDYSKEKIKVAETIMKRDYELLYSKGILTSRYGVLLYRIAVTQGKFSTNSIGRFYGGIFKSGRFSTNGKQVRGYKVR